MMLSQHPPQHKLFNGLRRRSEHREHREGRQGREHHAVDADPIRQKTVREGRDSIGDQVCRHDESGRLGRRSEGVR